MDKCYYRYSPVISGNGELEVFILNHAIILNHTILNSEVASPWMSSFIERGAGPHDKDELRLLYLLVV